MLARTDDALTRGIGTKEDTALLDVECAELHQARQVATSAGCQLREREILPSVVQAAPDRLGRDIADGLSGPGKDSSPGYYVISKQDGSWTSSWVEGPHEFPACLVYVDRTLKYGREVDSRISSPAPALERCEIVTTPHLERARRREYLQTFLYVQGACNKLPPHFLGPDTSMVHTCGFSITYRGQNSFEPCDSCTQHIPPCATTSPARRHALATVGAAVGAERGREAQRRPRQR